MRIGIVGFGSSGKSTLFQLLTGAAPDHSAGRSGQLGVATITDPRLDVLTKLYQPAKVTHATLELLDAPGLDPRGGGDNPQVLGVMRQVDGLLMVLGQYLGGEPADELQRLQDELVLADLALITGRIDKVEASLKKPRPHAEREAAEHELATLKQAAAKLEAGHQAKHFEAAEYIAFRAYQLFVLKPRFAVINQAESAIGSAVSLGPAGEGVSALALAAKLELELSQLDGQERQSFMTDLGLESLSRDRLVLALTRGTMGQITFFTVGPKEVRGWPLAAGATAVEAAGRIHTDLAHGFIRAEVIHYDDLIRCGSEREAKKHGLYRLEGKEYVVQDGDVMLIRFNV
ncbi:MAG: redox-regulated ATPase YchF [Planctomycetes bacterium]|nr:redox-regulated ATPase YchF [Planctomycetota bacterium]